MVVQCRLVTLKLYTHHQQKWTEQVVIVHLCKYVNHIFTYVYVCVYVITIIKQVGDELAEVHMVRASEKKGKGGSDVIIFLLKTFLEEKRELEGNEG